MALPKVAVAVGSRFAKGHRMSPGEYPLSTPDAGAAAPVGKDPADNASENAGDDSHPKDDS